MFMQNLGFYIFSENLVKVRILNKYLLSIRNQ
jgi:hypothetical protein